MTALQLFLTILVIAAVTFFTRAAPFALFGERPAPAYVKYLGRVLPAALIGMLVAYCFKDTLFALYPYGIPELIAGAAVVLLHRYRKNLFLSMLAGTVCYMFLVQLVFV